MRCQNVIFKVRVCPGRSTSWAGNLCFRLWGLKIMNTVTSYCKGNLNFFGGTHHKSSCPAMEVLLPTIALTKKYC